MGKWYDKIFIGNPNKEDFSTKDLPKTRTEQFFDVIKLRFGGLITSNLVFALFMIPLVVWTLYNLFLIQFAETSETVNVSFIEILDMYLLINVPLYTLMGPATAGMYYCIRNWVWNRRATIGEHFWKEFKRSWKQSAFLNLFNSVLCYATFFWIRFLHLNAGEAAPYISVPLVCIVALYYMSSIYQYPQLVSYNLTVKQIMKNSIIYMCVQLPRTLIAVILYLALGILCLSFAQLFLAVAMSIGFGVVFLGNMILSDFLFDKYVNEPENRRKGMAPLK